jgi:cell division protein ZapA (FtsZ GTPase activity inhibitor)
MPDLKVVIGGRNFNISCNPGEESAAKESASFLDQEAELVQQQLGRLTEDKMLLLSGLLLGDKIRALRHEQSALEERLRTTQSKLNELSLTRHTSSNLGNDLPKDSPTVNSQSFTDESALVALQSISDMLDNVINAFNTSIKYSNQEHDFDDKPQGTLI